LVTQPKSAIIGTAGHVDHGKTTLVKALTGIDTDRLAEEKKRGITIENGFAHLNLPGGARAGIIDVPGHEKFIHNMLAGSGGLDIALLVIAADDGIMPQTKEHLDILSLLNIKKYIVALTKCDLVADEEWLELVTDEIRDLMFRVVKAEVDLIRVSVQTGQGLVELKNRLISLVAEAPPPKAGRNFRLPIDRVFTLIGFGTVVTGTLLEGRVAEGEMATIYPSGISTKIRRIQVHSTPVDLAWPGQRVALNLTGLKKEDLARGDVLATVKSLNPTFMLDVRLSVLSTSPFTVKNGRLVHLYLGTAELLAKVVLMNEVELSAGQSSYAQLRLKKPAVAKKGDRFVIRFYSPMVTVGGGEVLDAQPLKRRRFKSEIIRNFETREMGTSLQRLELAIGERPGTFSNLVDLVSRADLDPAQVKNSVRILTERKVIIPLTPDIFIHRREMTNLTRKMKIILSEYHRFEPSSLGPSLEEIRSRLIPDAASMVSEALFRIFEEQKLTRCESGRLRLASFEPKVDEKENDFIIRLEQLYLEFGWQPPATSAVSPAGDPYSARLRKSAFTSLLRQGRLIYLDELYYLHKVYYDLALQNFRDLAAAGAPVTVAQYRDSLNTSRKVAVALLENFDRAALTVKSGEGRLPTGARKLIKTI
jgi:selenocysteine-specific elongation factor